MQSATSLCSERPRTSELKDKTKTDAGRRRVDLSDQLLQVLRQHHRKWTEKHLASGGKLPAWVFQTETGKLLAQNTLRRVFDRALAKIGLEHRRIHDIRHTYASSLLSVGTPILYVKEQLGHRSIQMTVDIYGHFIPSSSRAAVNALDDQAGKEYTCRTK